MKIKLHISNLFGGNSQSRSSAFLDCDFLILCVHLTVVVFHGVIHIRKQRFQLVKTLSWDWGMIATATSEFSTNAVRPISFHMGKSTQDELEFIHFSQCTGLMSLDQCKPNISMNACTQAFSHPLQWECVHANFLCFLWQWGNAAILPQMKWILHRQDSHCSFLHRAQNFHPV